DRQLYVADGHHRYETALTYRDEQRVLRSGLTADDAANFTLMALSSLEDRGLVVQPTHRILRDLDPLRVAELGEQMSRYFAVTPLDTPGVATMLAALGDNARDGSTSFALVGPNGLLLLRLQPAGRQAMSQLDGEHATASAAWRTLDLAILHELVLRRGLGITS